MNFMEKFTQEHKLELNKFVKEYQRSGEEIRRAQAILMLAENVSEELVLILTGLKRKTAVKLRKKYFKLGLEGIKSKRKKKKPKALLTRKQKDAITEMLSTKTPRDFGWDMDHWTTGALGQYILETYEVKYKSKTSLHLIFKESKLSYRKPDTVYDRHNQETVDEWKKANKPIVKQAMTDDNTVILVADEMIITSQTTTQKVWMHKDSKPVIQSTKSRKRKNIYGFLDIKTGKEVAFQADQQTSETSVKILKKVLLLYSGKKVLLYWDNASWHKGEVMREFLTTCSNFKIINFPTYAPKENPQEHVWKAARANITHNKLVVDINKTTEDFLEYLNNSIFKYEFLGFTAN